MLGMVVYTFTPRTWEADAARSVYTAISRTTGALETILCVCGGGELLDIREKGAAYSLFIVTIHDKNKFLLDTVPYTSCPRLTPLIPPAL